MSELRALAAWLVVSAALVGRTGAQDAASYRRRLDSLSRRVDTLARERRPAVLRVALDTIRAGRLTVVALRAAGPRATAAAESAWSVVGRTYGHAANALDTRVFVLTSPVLRSAIPVERGQLVVSTADYSPWSLVTGAASYMAATADSALQRWEDGVFVPAPGTEARWAMLHIELATSPWHRVQECFRGSLASCRLALGLDGADSAAALWYDREDREYYLRTIGYGSDSCILQQVEDACAARIQQLTRGTVPIPFSREARHRLLAFALDQGSPGAYDRLLAGRGGPMAIRLGAAAGLAPDSLITAWRARVLATPPRATGLGARSGWTALGWCVLLALAALRSSRWR